MDVFALQYSCILTVGLEHTPDLNILLPTELLSSDHSVSQLNVK